MTDKFNPINVWNKHRYEDRIETVDIEHDDVNDASKVHGTTVTHHYEREQRSSSIDEVTHAETQREPVQIHPSNFDDYITHSDHMLVQDSDVKNRTEDMVSRVPPTLQDLNKSNKGEPPEYQAKSPLTHDKDISFFGDSKVANDKSRSTLDQEGLHRGSVTTLPAAGQRRKSSQKSPDHISRNEGRSSQETGSEIPESNQYHNNKGSRLIDMAVATVATVGAVGASVATGVSNALTGSPTKESNHDMPSSWPSSEESVNTDNGEIKDTQSKTSTYRSNKDTKSSDDLVTKDDKHGFCDRIEEPEIQGQNPSFYDNSSKSRRWSEGWHRSNSATPPESRTFSKGLLATGAATTGATAAGAATLLGKQSSAKTGETITKDSEQDTFSNSPNDDFIENGLSEGALVDSDDSYTDSGIPSTWGDQVTPVSQYPDGSKTYENQANQGYKGDEGITSLPRNVNRMHRQKSRSSQGLNYSNSQDQNLVDQFSSGDRTNKLASAVAAGSLTGAGATAACQNSKNENKSKEEENSPRWLSNQDNNSSNDSPSQELSHNQWTEVDQDIKPKTWTKQDQSLPIGTGQDKKHEAFVDQNLNRSGTKGQTTTIQQTTTIVQEQKAFGGSSAFGNTGTTAVADNQHKLIQEDSQSHNSSSKGIVGAAAAAVGGLFGFAAKEKNEHHDSTDNNSRNTRQIGSDHIHDDSYEEANDDTITPIEGGRSEVDQNKVKVNRDGRYESAHDTNLESIGGRYEVDSSSIDNTNISQARSSGDNHYSANQSAEVPSSQSKNYEEANDDTITPIGGGRFEVDQNDVKVNRDGSYGSSHATNVEPLGGGRYEVDSSPIDHNDASRHTKGVNPSNNSLDNTKRNTNVPSRSKNYEEANDDTITPIGGGRYEVDQNDVKVNRDGSYGSSHATNVEPLGGGRYEVDSSNVVCDNESNYESVQENTVDPIRGNNRDSNTVHRNNDTGKGAVAGAAAGAAAAVGAMFGLDKKNEHDTSTRSSLPVSNLDQDKNNDSTAYYSHSKPDNISNNQRDRSSPQRGINSEPRTSNVETRGDNVNTEDLLYGDNNNHVYGQTTDNNTYGDSKGNAFYGANIQNNTTYGQNEIFEETAANKSRDKKVTYQDEPISTYNDDDLTKTATVVDHDDPKRRNAFAPTDFSGNEPDEAGFQNASTETRNVQRVDHHPVQHTAERIEHHPVQHTAERVEHHPVQHTAERVEHHPLEQASERRKENNPIQQNSQQHNLHSNNAQTGCDIENQNTEPRSAKTAIASALGLDHNKHSNDISNRQDECISTTRRNKDVPSVPRTSNTDTTQPGYNVEKKSEHKSAKTAITDALGLDHHNKRSDDVTTYQNEPITTTHRDREVPNVSHESRPDTVNPPYGYDIYHGQDTINHNRSDEGIIGSAAAAAGGALGLNHEHTSQDKTGHSNPYHSVQGQGHQGEGIHDRNVIGGTAVGSNDHTDINHTTTHEPIATTTALGSTLGGDSDANHVAATHDTNSNEKKHLKAGRRDSIVPGLPSEIAEEDHSGNFATSEPIPFEPSTHNREPPSNHDRRGSKGSNNRRRSSIISAMMGGDHKNKKYSDKDTGYERSQKYQDSSLYSGRTKSLPSVKQHDADVRGSLFNYRYAEESDVVEHNSGQYARSPISDNNAGSNKIHHLPTHHEDDPSHIDRDTKQPQATLADEPVHPMDTSRHGNNYESYEIENLKHDPVRNNSKSGNGIISSAGGILGLNHHDNNDQDATVKEHRSSMVASTVGVAGASAAPSGGIPALREGPFSESINAADQPKHHKAMVASKAGAAGASAAPVGGALGQSGKKEKDGTHVGHDASAGRNHIDNQRNTQDPPISNRSYSSGQNNRNSLYGREAVGIDNTGSDTTTTTGGQRVTATEAAVAAAPRGNINISDSQYNNAYANANNKSSKGSMAAVCDKLGITHHNETGQNQTVNYQDHARFSPRENVNYQGDSNHQDFNRSNHLSENNNDTIHRGQQNPMINETSQPSSHEDHNRRRSSAHARDVESVSSTRATTGKIVPDICNQEVARRRSSVHQPGDYNTIDHLNNPSHRKNSLTQDIKDKFTNVVRRLSNQGSDAPHNERRLSAAEVYKNEQQSTNHYSNALGNNAEHGTIPSYQEQSTTRGTNVAPRNEPITSTTRNANTEPRDKPITGTSQNVPITSTDNLNTAPRNNVPINRTTSRNINAAPLNSNVLSRNETITGTRPAQQSNVLPQNNAARPIVIPRDNVLHSTSGSNRTNANTQGTRQGNSQVPGVYTLRPAGEINIINNEASPNGPVTAFIVPAKEGA